MNFGDDVTESIIAGNIDEDDRSALKIAVHLVTPDPDAQEKSGAPTANLLHCNLWRDRGVMLDSRSRIRPSRSPKAAYGQISFQKED